MENLDAAGGALGHGRLSTRFRNPWVIGAILFVACQSNPITIGNDLVVGGASNLTGGEVSADFIPSFEKVTSFGTVIVPPRLIYQYNNYSWSFTSDGTNWTNESVTATMFAPGQVQWFGDPQVAAFPGGQGIVVASALGGTTVNTSDMVVVNVSTDGGETYAAGNVVNGGDCGGPADQESVAFDPSDSTPTIYVAWRYIGAPIQGGATAGACLRGGRVSTSDGTINWFSPPTPVQNLDREPFYGVGGLIVLPSNVGSAGLGPGSGKGVTIVYSNTDNFHEECPSPGSVELRWFSVTTPDTGKTWGPSHQILDSHLFAPCTPGNRYIKANRGSFGATRDAAGSLWAAVNDTEDTAQIFVSNDEGQNWFFNHTAVFPGLLFPTMRADQSGRVALFFYGATDDPTVDHAGNDLGSTTTPLLMYRSPFVPAPIAWTEPVACGDTFASVNLLKCNSDSDCPGLFAGDNNGRCTNGQCVGTRGLGDYEGMAPIPPGNFGVSGGFAPGWTDQPSAIPPPLFGTRVHTSFDQVNQ